MDREQSAYQQEKALNGLFAERDFGVISREKLCRICGCKENRWGSEQVFYLAVLHINKEVSNTKDFARWIMTGTVYDP